MTPAVGDIDSLKIIASQKRDVTIHLKVDTGMNRAGFSPSDIPAVLDILQQSQNLDLEGVSTHFADADNPDPVMTNAQIDRFIDVIQQVHNV